MTRVEMICEGYESGYVHGVKGDGLDITQNLHSDPEMAEAYQYGYSSGMWKLKQTMADGQRNCQVFQ